MNPGNILIIDDNKQILDSLQILLKGEYGMIDAIRNPNRIPEMMRTRSFDLILLDMNFRAGMNTGNEGIFWLREIMKVDPLAVVILITAYGDVELAVQGMKEGATDFITKPWDAEKLLATLHSAYRLRRSRLETQNLKNKQEQLNRDIDKQFMMHTGTSRVMQEVYKTIGKVAVTDANVLILGENGTGKELIARELHRRSERRNEVFIAVDMGSLSETLFESEMFGHEKGAFTGADETRIGRFENASGGTLFLDEIGNLSPAAQSKLLAAMQNRTINRVGSNKPIPVDIRLVSATNREPSELIAQQLFREDLLFRINTIEIRIPPLRERKEDIPGLARYFLDHFTCRYNKAGLQFGKKALEEVMEYHWPGNARELKHAMEKAVILSEGDVIQPADLGLKRYGSETGIISPVKLSDVERQTIARVLERCRGNMTRTARMLDISRTTLYSKIEKYNL